ncbi:MAG: TlpA family protein disulfide reductase [Akkermansia sp.]|nr:TlpA family protein disulfide reductase [Akkermansia sp.]
MKRTFIASLLAVICCCSINAQETVESTAVSAIADNNSAVPARLQQMEFISEAKPAADAQFYVYLSSASWCPPCRAIMPRIVAQYPAIKNAGGEIILLCCDRTTEAGLVYLKKYGIPFPAIMVDPRSVAGINLPGFQIPRGIPSISIVNPAGELIHAGHGATLLRWQDIIKK